MILLAVLCLFSVALIIRQMFVYITIELTPSYKILAVDSIVNTTMNNNKFNTNFDLQLLLMSSQNQ